MDIVSSYNKSVLVKKMAEYTPRKINEMLDTFGVTSKRRRAVIHKMIPQQKKYLISESFTSRGALQTHADMIIPMMVRAMSDVYMLDLVGVQPQKKSHGYAYGVVVRPAGRSEKNAGGTQDAVIDKSNSMLVVTDLPTDGTDPAGTVTDPLLKMVEYTLAGGTLAGVQIMGITVEDNKVLFKVTNFNGVTLDTINTEINDSGTAITTVIGGKTYEFISGFKDVDMLIAGLRTYSGSPETTAYLEDPTDTANHITLEMTKVPYTAKSRKLKANYSIEAVADAMNDNGVDLREMGDEAMADEITKEIDRWIYFKMKSVAKTGEADFDYAALGWHTQDTTKTLNLVGKINKICTKIAKSGRIGRGNFAILTGTVMSAIEQLESFVPAPPTETGEGFRGTISGVRYYVNLDIDDDVSDRTVIVGVKGNAEHKAGLIFLPYIGITLSVGQGEDSTHEKITMSHRSDLIENVFGGERYYTKFNVKGLNFL